MLTIEDFGKVLFLDIETVRAHRSFEELPEHWQKLWDQKTQSQRQDIDAAQFYKDRGGILAEFGKIICISVGYLRIDKTGNRQFRTKSFWGDDEPTILQNFAALLHTHYASGAILCAHNGKEFDFPYIARRMVIHQIPLPSALNTFGKKPWEVHHLDTMELWKFGDRKNFTALKLLTACLGIPSPKDDIDGSQVGQVYWEENNLQRIANYCQKDVLAVAQVVLRFCGQPLLSDAEIETVNE